jgi:hypothetical protein
MYEVRQPEECEPVVRPKLIQVTASYFGDLAAVGEMRLTVISPEPVVYNLGTLESALRPRLQPAER